jgi:UDP-2-acetamido-3-amino-2,3-dideoxy-glucuronate N-acetyltransferase
MAQDRGVFVHERALCETDRVGAGTRIWAFAHVMKGAAVGRDCNIGDHAFVESGAVVGDRVTLKNGVMVWSGITIEDDVFVGPGVVFTNDRYPRSPRLLGVAGVADRYADESRWLLRTHVERGASIGARAVLAPGVRIGAFAMIAAGAVVTRDVPPNRLVSGVPGQVAGLVCYCGRPVPELPASAAECVSCPEMSSRADDR